MPTGGDGRLSFTPLAANALTVVSSRASVTATTGDPRVSLTCNVKGGATEVNTFCASNQFLLWRVNGTLLNETSYESDFLAQGNCTHSNLIFLRVFPELEGRYTCELSNNQTVLAMTGVNIRPGTDSGAIELWVALCCMPCVRITYLATQDCSTCVL